jgi:predicted DNA-binding transcriptional regulator AlpA
MQTKKDNTPHPMAALQQAKERDAQFRKENKERDRQQRESQQLKDVDDGVGFSSDKILARYYDTTRKTIWTWARDPDNPFPQPKKISANMTRWVNVEIKAHRANQLMGQLYGQ